MSMTYEKTTAWYRHWYAKLLRFYPKPYRDRFGASMEQTFNDLCRERRATKSSLFSFVLWMFAETSAGIIKENITFITMKNPNMIIRPALLTVGILLIPFLGNLFIDGWNWSWSAFAFFGVVLFGAGLAYELVGRKAKPGVIGGFGVGVIIGLIIIAVLRYLNPEEDPAGIVIITLLLSGLIFAFVGYLIQHYLKKMQ